MHSLFVPADREALSRRLAELQPEARRRWGKMDPAQMLLHCALGVEAAMSDRPVKQVFMGRLFAPFVRRGALGDRPFRRNIPTDASFVVSDARAFEAECLRLATVIDRFVQRGPRAVDQAVHLFFGRLSGEEWGILMYKHLDHHLRQFGV